MDAMILLHTHTVGDPRTGRVVYRPGTPLAVRPYPHTYGPGERLRFFAVRCRDLPDKAKLCLGPGKQAWEDTEGRALISPYDVAANCVLPTHLADRLSALVPSQKKLFDACDPTVMQDPREVPEIPWDDLQTVLWNRAADRAVDAADLTILTTVVEALG